MDNLQEVIDAMIDMVMAEYEGDEMLALEAAFDIAEATGGWRLCEIGQA